MSEPTASPSGSDPAGARPLLPAGPPAVPTDGDRPEAHGQRRPGALDAAPEAATSEGPAGPEAAGPGPTPARRRRRPSATPSSVAASEGEAGSAPSEASGGPTPVELSSAPPAEPAPRIGDTRPSPRIGDTRPAPAAPAGGGAQNGRSRSRSRSGGRKSASAPAGAGGDAAATRTAASTGATGNAQSTAPTAVGAPTPESPAPTGTGQADTGQADTGQAAAAPAGRSGRSRRRSGRDRKGRPVGRYQMCVHVRPHATQIAVLEGRTLVEHVVSRAADEATQIDGNIYRGRVQNVLPGMEAAFIDIGTPKNAVLYRGDVRYDRDDVETSSGPAPRIEQMLRPGQTILCQVTKNPIGAKGARLTQEVSLPGRFVVMVPNSSAFGISKRLDDAERRRLRRIVDDVRPKGHGLIVRTAAEGASQEELANDVERLLGEWAAIEAEAARSSTPGLLYREPDLAVRIVREEFNREYRGVVIDDEGLYRQVREYVERITPELADRVEYYDAVTENLPIFERFHVHEQLHKALDRKVWLPSGGSLIIERTEALTVIDVNTGKNVGTSNLEETVYRNNLEAAEEIARQLRLRDIGGIIVIDFIDMEIRENRDKVSAALRSALARDKTRTQVFDISELGLVEMTRKRVSEGLVESLSRVCDVCNGRGIVLDESLL